jgi:hypothetical protein
MHTKFQSENLKRRDYYKDRHTWKHNIKTNLKRWGEIVDWIHVTKDTYQWQAAENMPIYKVVQI